MPARELTAAQRAQYDEYGYTILRDFFSEAELRPLVDRLLAIVRGVCDVPADMLVMRDVMVVKGEVKAGSPEEAVAKIQDFHNDKVLFEGYSKHPKLLDFIEGIVGPDIQVVHTMLINKPPYVDGRHPLHQDLLYFPFRPADWIVATSTALEKVTRDNGCMVVIPRSHKGELLEHENPDWEHLNAGYFGARDLDEQSERVHLEMNPGDIVFFHPLLLHGAGRNRTSGFRRTILSHYASAKCRYLPGADQVGELRPYRLVRGQNHPHGL